MTEFIPAEWESNRCTLRLVREEDLPALIQILEDNQDLLRLLGDTRPISVQAREILDHGALPPGGEAAREKSFLIRDKLTRAVIGILTVYFGYPGIKTAYIGSLFFRNLWQRQGLGREVVDGVEKIARLAEFNEARLAVSLYNWPALRFWISLGYNQVTKIKGDDEFGEGKYAVIEFRKPLS